MKEAGVVAQYLCLNKYEGVSEKKAKIAENGINGRRRRRNLWHEDMAKLNGPAKANQPRRKTAKYAGVMNKAKIMALFGNNRNSEIKRKRLSHDYEISMKTMVEESMKKANGEAVRRERKRQQNRHGGNRRNGENIEQYGGIERK